MISFEQCMGADGRQKSTKVANLGDQLDAAPLPLSKSETLRDRHAVRKVRPNRTAVLDFYLRPRTAVRPPAGPRNKAVEESILRATRPARRTHAPQTRAIRVKLKKPTHTPTKSPAPGGQIPSQPSSIDPQTERAAEGKRAYKRTWYAYSSCPAPLLGDIPATLLASMTNPTPKFPSHNRHERSPSTQPISSRIRTSPAHCVHSTVPVLSSSLVYLLRRALHAHLPSRASLPRIVWQPSRTISALINEARLT